MDALKQKMYAYLVGEIDDILDIINEALEEDCENIKLIEVGEKLQDALLTVEEMYISHG